MTGGNGTHRTVEIGAVYVHAATGEQYSAIAVATDATTGRDNEHVVVYFEHATGETLVRTLADWCEVVDGRPRFVRVGEDGR